MPNIAIQAINISKKFDILAEKKSSVKDSMFRKLTDKFSRTSIQEFWALKNISFEIYEGESIGIIGMNGAGKTTLLKILSDIIRPTSGKVNIHGQLAAILEIGVGFHQELSGRENIFLYGKMLGFSNLQIKSKFDEIVDFSEIWSFIDTPIKHYSSGMVMRLGFAVIAFLETDIILLDEMLSVGDIHFRSKCLNKIMELKNNNRTIIIVGHDLHEISNYCDKLFLLDKGQLVDSGPSVSIINKYQQILLHYDDLLNNKEWNIYREKNQLVYNESLKKIRTRIEFAEDTSQVRSLSFRLIFIEIISTKPKDKDLSGFSIDKEILVRIRAQYFSGKADVAFVVNDMMNNRIFGDAIFKDKNKSPLSEGIYDFNWYIPPYIFNAGVFKLGIILFDEYYNPVYSIMDLLNFTTVDNETSNSDFGLYVPIKPKIKFDFKAIE